MDRQASARRPRLALRSLPDPLRDVDAPLCSVWGLAYGSYGRTGGNAHAGSARSSIDDAHLATGIDVRLMPGMVAGVAVSGGKARASLPRGSARR